MREVLAVSVQMALGIALPWWILRWDMRRSPPERLARAWPDASLWVALVGFGPLCLPFHFVRTRRSLLGLLLGIGALFLCLGVSAAVAALLEA